MTDSISSESRDDIEQVNTLTDEDLQDLEYYKQILDDAILSNKPTLIPNSGRLHAAAMYSKMFDATKDKFFLVVRNFAGEVADQDSYYDSLEKCLQNPNITGEVLLLDGVNKTSRAFQLLNSYYDKSNNNSKVVIRTCHNDTLTQTQESLRGHFNTIEDVFNWAVFDDHMYRLETKPLSFGAVGGIHQKNDTEKLKRLFRKAFDAAEPY